MMKKIITPVLAGAVALSFAAGADTASAADFKVKMHHQVSAKAPVNVFLLTPLKKALEKDSGGRISAQVYHAMSLGGRPPQVFNQIKDGITEIGWTLPGYSGGRFPLTSVFDLPFMVSTAEATTQAFQEFGEKHLKNEYKDVVPLLYHTAARFKIHMVKKQIKTIADFKGLKVRATNRGMGELLKSVGATPVFMPVPKVPQALSKGVVAGAVLPWEIVIPFKIQQIAPNHTLVEGRRGLIAATFFMGMNKKFYDGLPGDLKKVVQANTGMNIAAKVGKAYDGIEGKFKGLAAKRGNKFATLSDADVNTVKASAAKIHQAWVADVTKKGHDGKALLAEANALIEKYTK